MIFGIKSFLLLDNNAFLIFIVIDILHAFKYVAGTARKVSTITVNFIYQEQSKTC